MVTDILPSETLRITIMSEGQMDAPHSGGESHLGNIKIPPPVLQPKDQPHTGFLALVDNKILTGDWTVKPRDPSDLAGTKLLLLSLTKGDVPLKNGFAIWLKETEEGLIPLSHARGTVSKYIQSIAYGHIF